MAEKDNYEVTWLVRRLFRAMASASTHSLQDLGISAVDRAVLEFLYPHDCLSVPEIAARYDVSRQHVQVTVNRLQTRKLLVAKNNPRHKRSQLYCLTGEGRSLFKQVLKRDKQLIETLFTDIPDNNVQVTERTLRTLYTRLREGEIT